MEIWVILVMFAVAAAQYCDFYLCKPYWMKWSEGTCGFYNSTETTWYFEDTCGSGEVCTQSNSSSYSNYTCSEPGDPIPTIIYPGDVCGSGRICSNDPYCRSGETCPGQNLGESCSGPGKYCAPELYCALDQTCQRQKIEGSICSSDSECYLRSGCRFDPDYESLIGNCTRYFSLEVGDYVDSKNYDKNNQISYFCPYLSALQSNNGTIQCSESLYLNNTEPYYCSWDSDCRSNTFYINEIDTTVSTSCTCGINQYRNRYCNLLPGDSYNSDYLYYFKYWVSWYQSRLCSEAERLTLGPCANDNWYSTYYIAASYYKMRGSLYPIVQDAYECVVKTLYPDYYKIKQEFNNTNGAIEESLITE